MYKENFKELVKLSASKTREFYSKSENNGKPNPYYVGFGNPNARIVIFGKEKGFNETNLKQLEYESINNPIEWENYVENNVVSNKNKFYKSENYINTFFPYSHSMKSGHTWNKYYKLIDIIYSQVSKNENDFLNHVFLSEINYKPSKISVIKKVDFNEREAIIKSSFFKSFDVIILACGNYLNKSQIENMFNVTYVESILKPRENIFIYKNSKQIVINTRQLSMDASNDLLTKIATLVKSNLN